MNNLYINKGLKKGKKGTSVVKLQQFLENHGFLKITDETYPLEVDPFCLMKKDKGVFESTTENALKSYQRFHGLEPSGIWDATTTQAHESAICAAPDIISLKPDFSINILLEKPIKYIVIGGPSILSENQQEIHEEGERSSKAKQAAARAFSIWALVTPLRFIEVAKENEADITIRFAPIPGAPIGNALIEIDDEEGWSIGNPIGSRYDLISTMAHEIGHRLGLNHSSDSNSIMFASQVKRHIAASNSDIVAIQSLFDSPKITQVYWNAGISVQVEFPNRLTLERKAGPYSLVIGKRGTINWFHFPIPITYQFPENADFNIHAASIRFRTYSGNVQVQRVAIWNGAELSTIQPIFLEYSGIHIWEVKISPPEKPKTKDGISISLEVWFQNEGQDDTRRVDWFSAGVDLTRFVGQIVQQNTE